MNLGSAQVIQGNALALPLPDNSVDLICTSPPYFGLRSYQDRVECPRCRQYRQEGRDLRQAWPDYDKHVEAEHKPSHYAGQIGSEATPAEFLDALLAATREMVRVLKPSGSIFVNLGDKYNSAASGHKGKLSHPESTGVIKWQGDYRINERGTVDTSVPVKSLMGIPWRYAIACIDQLGLILRAEIIWAKNNGLPESVQDRVRRSHEYWFHFTKSPRYFSAVDEIRERHNSEPGREGRGALGGQKSLRPVGPKEFDGTTSVWRVPTQPLIVPPELGIDHFAAFPFELPRRIIQGWTPNGICTACNQPRTPTTKREYSHDASHANGRFAGESVLRVEQGSGDLHKGRFRPAEMPHGRANLDVTITGYACGCGEWPLSAVQPSTTPAVVLDPFGGTGTTALVAKALGRIGITVDLSADYCRLAEWRCNDPRELAAALQVEKPEPVHPDQLDLFSEAP